MFASPAVAGELLFIGSCSGFIQALDKRTGEVVWSYDTDGDAFHGDPLIFGNWVIMPSDDRAYDSSVASIYALEQSSGSVVWRHDFTEQAGLGTGVTTDLRRFDSTVLGVTTTDRLVCLDLRTGAVRWERQSAWESDERFWPLTPALIDTAVIYASLDGHVFSLNAASGDVNWQAELSDRPTTAPLVYGDRLYCGSADGTLTTLELRTGVVRSEIPLEGMPVWAMRAVVSGGDTLIVCNVREFGSLTSGSYSVMAVEPASGRVQWRADAEAGTPWSIKQVYMYRGSVLVGRSDGIIYLLDPATGKVVQSFMLGGEIRSIGADGDMLFVGTIGGTVYGVTVEDEEH